MDLISKIAKAAVEEAKIPNNISFDIREIYRYKTSYQENNKDITLSIALITGLTHGVIHLSLGLTAMFVFEELKTLFSNPKARAIFAIEENEINDEIFDLSVKLLAWYISHLPIVLFQSINLRWSSFRFFRNFGADWLIFCRLLLFCNCFQFFVQSNQFQLNSCHINNTSAKQIKFCPPIHLPFDKFQPINLSFDLSLTPFALKCLFDRFTILLDSICKPNEFADSACPRFFKPAFEAFHLTITHQLMKLFNQFLGSFNFRHICAKLP